MKDFSDSIAKRTVRNSIFDYSKKLNDDSKFVYLGLPGSRCWDISSWKENIEYAYCYEMDESKYREMQRKLHLLIPGRNKTYKMNIWEGLENNEELFIDLCNLDFYGGPSSSEIPEISEFKALSNFFAHQRSLSDSRSFLIAWTFGIRNQNFGYYRDGVINYFKELYGSTSVDGNKLTDWLSETGKKMTRVYFYFLPCISFHYAQNCRYTVELLDSKVYKKIMYFSLLKFQPSDQLISDDERKSFFEDVFQRIYPVLDSDGKLIRTEKIPVDEFILE